MAHNNVVEYLIGEVKMDSYDSSILITPSALLTLLSQVEELKGYDIGLSEEDNKVVLTIGESTYQLEPESQLEVSEDIVEDVNDINDEGYNEFAEIEDSEPVEGGIIKEVIKTLALGGLIRLTKNALLNS